MQGPSREEVGGAHLEVAAVLRCILQRPEGAYQVRQLLRDLSRGAARGRFRLRVRLAGMVLAKRQVLGEELGVAEALQRGVHEARVPVVPESCHPRDWLRGGRRGRRRGHGRGLGGRRAGRRRRRPGREAAAEAPAVRAAAFGAQVRECGQRLEDATHEATHRAR